MKICPRCEKTYPDTESFCETDGSALVSTGPAFAQPGASSPSSGKVECPVCGGQAEPGEVICNFCGTRLVPEEAPPPPSEPRRAPAETRRAPTQAHRQPQGRPSGPTTRPQPRSRRLAIIGYLVAAVLALVAGIYLALHLAPHEHQKLATAPSPSAVATPTTPVAMAQPLVALANLIPLQVIPGSGAPSSELTTAIARSRFDDHKSELLDAYKHLLSENPAASDGMMVRVHVLPDGTVDRAAVRTSTSPNPELDANVVKSMMGWKFVATGGPEADIDYPVIFAPSESERAKVESALQTRVATLTPSEAPEYASSTAPPTPIASPSPEVAAAPSPAPLAEKRPAPTITRRRTRRKELAAIPRPTPSLLERVQKMLKSNPKLRRVHAYTAGGTVTLYGKVFDTNDRLLAERVVRGIPGVTGVVNTVTTDTAQWRSEEDKIKRELVNAGLPNVNVKVIGNDAYLSGSVKTSLDRERAVTIAEGAAPVTVRSNIIRVEPGSVFGF